VESRRIPCNKLFIWSCLLTLAALTLSWGASAATYYVDPAGNDSRAGTSSATAWRTLSKVQTFGTSPGFRAGDTILLKRGGVWRERLIVMSSGSDGNPIVFDAYGTGDKPRILASQTGLTWSSLGSNRWATTTLNLAPNNNVGFILLTEEVENPVWGVNVGKVVSSSSDLDADGEFCWEPNTGLGTTYGRIVMYTTHAGGPAAKWPQMEVGVRDRGVLVLGRSHVTLKNIDARYGTGGSFRIGEGSHHVILDGCEASYGGGTLTAILGIRAGDLIKMDTGCHDVTVRNCRVSNSWESGISAEAWQSNDVIYNITVEDNVVDRCSIGVGANTPYYDSVVNTELYNVFIRRNTLTNLGYGWTTPDACSHGVGVWCYQNERAPSSLHDCFIESNVIDTFSYCGIRLMKGQYIVVGNVIRNGTGVYAENQWDRPSGIAMHGGSYVDSTGDTYGTIAYNLVHSNNSAGMFFINNTPTTEYRVEVFNNAFVNNGTATIPNFFVYTANNISVRNNIFYSTNSIPFSVETVTQILSNNNCFYRASGTMIRWHTTNYSRGQFAAYQTASQQDANSIALDPAFVSTTIPDLHLATGSPCIDAGVDLGLRSDFDGLLVPQWNGVDIGAYEYPNAPTVSVSSPVGGESWTAGRTYQILWSYTGNPGATVNVELVRGATTTTLASGLSIGTGGSGAYYWPVPLDQTPASDYRVRVVSVADPSVAGVSASTFTINAPPAPVITVTTPNGGENWFVWQTQTIRWTFSGETGSTVKIELLNGTTPTVLASSVPIGIEGEGSWEWQISLWQSVGTNYRIRITSNSVPTCLDTSNAAFTISSTANPTLTLDSPNGGEVWTTLETKQIQWSYTGRPTTTVKIELLKGGVATGFSVLTPLGSDGSGSWDWAIPDWLTTGTDYRIRISSTDPFAYLADTSNADFTINAPPPDSIALITPNGGEAWTQGETRQVNWTYTGTPGETVSIEILDGEVATLLATNVPIGAGGSGSWNWPISLQQAAGDNYRLRVTSTTDPEHTDTSDDPFRIKATAANTITVGVPNGDEHWMAWEQKTIRWYYTGYPGPNVRIEIVKGSQSAVLASNVPIGSGGSGSWTWWVWSYLDSASDYKIRITSTADSNVTDMSDGYFTISRYPSVRLVSPNGGEVWKPGTTQQIRWTYTGNPGSTVRIRLIKDSQTPILLASSAPIGSSGQGSWNYAIPESLAVGTDYKVDVTTNSFFFRSDASDGYFSILQDPPRVSGITMVPSSGKSLVGGSATFTVHVSEGTPPLTYQWQRNGQALAAGTDSVLTLSPVTSNDSGQYRCIVSNSSGSDTSDTATLSVASPLMIVSEPAGGTKLGGESHTFEVTAVGGFDPLYYQWFHDDVAVPGATNAQYSIAWLSGHNAGTYFVRVGDSASQIVESVPVTLEVDASNLPATGVIGLCIVMIVCAIAGAFLIMKRQ